MSDLLKTPFGTHGKVHQITPESAGRLYVGFSLCRLRTGETVAEATGDREIILVMVEGKASFNAAGKDWGVLGECMDDFPRITYLEETYYHRLNPTTRHTGTRYITSTSRPAPCASGALLPRQRSNIYFEQSTRMRPQPGPR